jgi:exonuclease VII small subunit
VAVAKTVLSNIERRRSARTSTARQRVLGMAAMLDVILARMPESPAEADLREIERIVNALHTADQNLARGAVSAGLQIFELARARIQRLAARLERGAQPSGT